MRSEEEVPAVHPQGPEGHHAPWSTFGFGCAALLIVVSVFLLSCAMFAPRRVAHEPVFRLGSFEILVLVRPSQFESVWLGGLNPDAHLVDGYYPPSDVGVAVALGLALVMALPLFMAAFDVAAGSCGVFDWWNSIKTLRLLHLVLTILVTNLWALTSLAGTEICPPLVHAIVAAVSTLTCAYLAAVNIAWRQSLRPSN